MFWPQLNLIKAKSQKGAIFFLFYRGSVNKFQEFVGWQSIAAVYRELLININLIMIASGVPGCNLFYKLMDLRHASCFLWMVMQGSLS